MQKIDIILVLSFIVLIMIAYCTYQASTKSELYNITCPDPSTMVGELKLSAKERKDFFKLCEQRGATPLLASADFESKAGEGSILSPDAQDRQTQQCLLGCYPDFTMIRDGRLQQLCKKSCKEGKDRTSPECLACVQDFYCQFSMGGQSYAPCDLMATKGDQGTTYSRGDVYTVKDLEAERALAEAEKNM